MGFPRSRTRAREPSVPSRLIGRAAHAERSCPLMALLLVREQPPDTRRRQSQLLCLKVT